MRNYRIIKKNYEFDRVYKRGKQCHGAELSLFFLKRKDHDINRLGVTVSRGIRGAVKRNRVKRVLRELFRAHADELRQGYDFILHGKLYPEAGMYAQFNTCFETLLKRAKVLDETTSRTMPQNEQVGPEVNIRHF